MMMVVVGEMKMMKALLFIITYMMCAIDSTKTQTSSGSPNMTDLAFNNMDFAMNLYRKISSYNDENIFFSPLSISSAFATLSMGAGGATREEILKGLNLAPLEQAGLPEFIPRLFQHLHGNITQGASLHPDRALQLDHGTALFADLKFEVRKTFSDQIKTFFNADINNVDFADTKASMATINEYIMQRTGNKVTDVVTSMDPLTQLMIISTIYFQGAWETPFNSNLTQNGPFYVDNYNVVQVPMMFFEDSVDTMEDVPLGAKVLKLPYQKGVSMLILLPNKGMDYTLIDEEITAKRFKSWITHLEKQKLEVNMPRFSMEESYALHQILPDLGVSSVFSESSNLTGLSKDIGLKVSEVLHKAVIEVDEAGTTAAAATSVGITAYSLPRTFTINRPFFFFIYHEETTSLLFMGRVIDPTKK